MVDLQGQLSLWNRQKVVLSLILEQYMNPIDAISFKVEGISFDSDRPNLRVFYTTDGDGMGLYYYSKPPDLPNGAASVLELRAFYEKMVSNGTARVVEVSTPMIDGCRVVRTILKFSTIADGHDIPRLADAPVQELLLCVKDSMRRTRTDRPTRSRAAR
jgi:hypothetical protein